MALYRGTVNLSGLESGFNPENPGSTGQVLTKTATGYNWQNGGGGGGGTYTAGAGINIDANNEISNTLPGAIVSATSPSNPTEGMVWYDTTNDALKAYNGTSWETEGTKMVVLEYGVSTWQDFIDAYNENALVYCKVLSSTTGCRMAFMAYIAGQTTPTEVEFQYYRSRDSHNTQANQLDQVFVYKLTNANGGTWSTIERNTGAKMVAGNGINIAFGSGNATISNDGVTSVNNNTGAVTVSEFSPGGTATTGYVVTKTANGYEWAAPTGVNKLRYFALPTVGTNVYDLVSVLYGVNTNHELAIIGDTEGHTWVATGYELHDIPGQTGAIYAIAYGLFWEGGATYNDKMKAVKISFPEDTMLCSAVEYVSIGECPGYEAGDGITIGERKNAMRGPCPEGFHVPTVHDRERVTNVVAYFNEGQWYDPTYPRGVSAHDFSTDLHLPFCYYGYEYNSGYLVPADLGNPYDIVDDTYFYYWTSEFNASSNKPICIEGTGDTAPYVSEYASSIAMPIRPFKDEFVYPTSGWTVIQGTLGSDGIFWNSSLGLISLILGDEAYTIADKNLGATVAYSVGDAFSQANCGHYYQWGNNNSFPLVRGSPTTTSQTQVDASSYGAGTYYSDDTFIEYSGNWDSSNNADLWGAVTGTYIDPTGNVIYNTGALSVNGSTGNVILSAGDNVQINGTTISATDTTYQAGYGIEIGSGIDFRTLRGPCPEGFHIPTEDEARALNNTFFAGDISPFIDAYIYLHVPLGPGGYSPQFAIAEEYHGCFWTASTYTTYGTWAGVWETDTSGTYIQHYGCGYAFNIRPFKDVPVVPDSSWTHTYVYNTDYGVFYNATLGLISVSKDGETRFTIADKNLGATTVYNNGDTLSQANVGYYYQRGNNHGFEMFGGVQPSKTSSTAVDVSGYLPSTYSSDTFITTAAWMSPHNPDMWGGVSGTTTLTNGITNTGVTSINGKTGNIMGLTKSENSPLNVKYFWAGTQAQYEALQSYDSETIYFTI